MIGGMTDTLDTESDHAADTADTRMAAEPRMVSIRKAAEITGSSTASIRGRVERGTLPHVLRDGRRMIPVSELRRAGLFRTTGDTPMAEETRTTTALLDRLVDAERRATAAETRLQLTQSTESSLTEALHRANAEREAAREQADAARLELTAERERADRLAADLEAIAAQPKRRRWFTREKG
jgi:hypothetical protein